MTTPAKLDWEAVARAAKRLGVGKEAFKKWRQRGTVPKTRRLDVIRASGGDVPLDAFDSPKRRGAAA